MMLQPPSPSWEKQAQKKKFLPEIRRLLACLLLFSLLALLFQAYILQPIRVSGTSMEYTLKNGEIVLVSKWLQGKKGMLSRGDIVICRYPGRMEREINISASLALQRPTIFIKRLVGLPGDTLEIREGNLYINGSREAEIPALGSTARDFGPVTLGENEYFVMGDNRFSSHDSRSGDVGPLSREMILGKAKWVIWPLQGIRKLQ